MKKTIISIVLCTLLIAPSASADKKNKNKDAAAAPAVPEFQLPSTETDEQKAERMKWWTDARFGMFIHWGLYSMPARHEWVKNREKISDEDYQVYFDHFNPDLFNPADWAKMCKNAGMKYVVLTTKHHEGFCMWDSKYTDYKVTNTPAGRDLLREFVDAFRAEGIHIGFYYSLIDWHHPDFTVDHQHPRGKDATPEEVAKMNEGKNMDNYRQYMKDQVTELLTNYGKIDIIWFDFSYPNPKGGIAGKGKDDWDSVGLLKLAKGLQPNIIVDDRLGMRDVWGAWDIFTPEQKKVVTPPTWNGRKAHWETCQTFSGSWGYYRDETTWKSPAQLIELLSETVSKDGNVLLNVGPTSRGEFDQRAQDRLAAMGKWMHSNGRSIYCCGSAPADLPVPANTVLTYNAETNCVYVHLLDYPLQKLYIDFMDKVEYAQFLHDGSELQIDRKDNYLKMPILKPDVEIPVVELFLKK